MAAWMLSAMTIVVGKLGLMSTSARVMLLAPRGSLVQAYYKPLLPWFGLERVGLERVGDAWSASVPLSYVSTLLVARYEAAGRIVEEKILIPPSPVLMLLVLALAALGSAAVLAASPNRRLAFSVLVSAYSEALLPVYAYSGAQTIWSVLDGALPGELRVWSVSVLVILVLPPALAAVNARLGELSAFSVLALLYLLASRLSGRLVVPGPAILVGLLVLAAGRLKYGRRAQP